MSSVVDGALFGPGPGGWYRRDDNSGPYTIDSAGNATLLTAVSSIDPQTLGASEDRSFTSASAQSGALTGTRIRVIAKDANCRIAIGSNPTATSTGTLILAGVPEYFEITSGHKVAAIRDGTVEGTLNITVVS